MNDWTEFWYKYPKRSGEQELLKQVGKTVGGTSITEGQLRVLIDSVKEHLEIKEDRMDITGAKWRLASAEAVLRLRALRSSNDFDEYWDFHEACEYKRNHQTLYADGEVPPTKLPQSSSKGGHLRVIK